MLTIGIIGLGHLGLIHLKQWVEIVPKEFITIYDIDRDLVSKIADEFKVKSVNDYDELLATSDIIDIVTPTNYHFEMAYKAMRLKKHLFIEKPVCESMDELNQLIQIQEEFKNVVQIGFVERYNPAFLAIKNKIQSPKFFEIHRLAPFNARGTEVSVIMDLMIHDLDIIAYFVDSEVRNLSANGVSVISNTKDIANVRIEFENGCVANITSSRISLKKMRKMRIFLDKKYATIDFLEKKSEIYSIEDKTDLNQGIEFSNYEGVAKLLCYEEFSNSNHNAINQELSEFYTFAMNGNVMTMSNLNSAKLSLELAIRIQKILQN